MVLQKFEKIKYLKIIKSLTNFFNETQQFIECFEIPRTNDLLHLIFLNIQN